MKIGPVKFLERTVIGEPLDPYMHRYILVRFPWLGIYVHKFLRSDHERALHDHPWPFVAIILKGGYVEVHDQTLDGKEIAEDREPGSLLVRPAEWRHRVMLHQADIANTSPICVCRESLPTHRHAEKPSWSLVFVGRRARRWGFFAKYYEAHPAYPEQGINGPMVAVETKRWCWWRQYNYKLGICEEQILHTDGDD